MRHPSKTALVDFGADTICRIYFNTNNNEYPRIHNSELDYIFLTSKTYGFEREYHHESFAFRFVPNHNSGKKKKPKS